MHSHIHGVMIVVLFLSMWYRSGHVYTLLACARVCVGAFYSPQGPGGQGTAHYVTRPFKHACIRQAPNLKLAITAGIGSDHVDLNAACDFGLTVAEITGAIKYLAQKYAGLWRIRPEGQDLFTRTSFCRAGCSNVMSAEPALL